MTADEETRLRERAQFTRLVATLPAGAIVPVPDSKRAIQLRKKLVDIDADNTVLIEYDAEIQGCKPMVAAIAVPLRLAAEEGAAGMIKRLGKIILHDAQDLLGLGPGARA